jgi:putative ABC transport system permease protein
MHLIVRTTSPANHLASAVRGAVRQIDREQPVWRVQTYEEMVHADLIGLRTISWLVVCLGILATVLAGIGVYAVTAQAVSERTHEMGLRMALGADPRTVVLAMLRRGAVVTVAGVAVGLVAAVLLARSFAGLIFGVPATDPASFIAVAAALGGLALLASYVPARRATRVDPLTALRYE